MRSTLDSFNRSARQLTEHPHLAELYYRGLDDFQDLEGVRFAHGSVGLCKQPLGMMTSSQHVYEVRRRKDHRCVDLISDVLPFGRLWYARPNAVANAIGYAKHRSRPDDAVIRVYDASNAIETHEHAGDFKEP